MTNKNHEIMLDEAWSDAYMDYLHILDERVKSGLNDSTLKCRVCDSILVARKGKERQKHYAHIGDITCSGETHTHRLSKDIIAEHGYIRVQWPDYGALENIVFDSIDVEQAIDQYRHDLVGIRNGERWILEVVVEHDMEEATFEHAKKHTPYIIKVDVKSLRGSSDDELRKALKLTSYMKWLHNAPHEEKVRAVKEAERAEREAREALEAAERAAKRRADDAEREAREAKLAVEREEREAKIAEEREEREAKIAEERKEREAKKAKEAAERAARNAIKHKERAKIEAQMAAREAEIKELTAEYLAIINGPTPRDIPRMTEINARCRELEKEQERQNFKNRWQQQDIPTHW